MAFFTSSTPAPAALDLAPGSPLLTLRDVEKAYPVAGGMHYVLRRIALEVRTGDFITIMGPSGAGKSTLLAILGLLDHDWRGAFTFAGEAVHALTPKARTALGRRHVGFVFQQYHLLDDLTVAENLDVPLEYRGVPRSERQALVADALDRFGIVGKKDLFPRQLSGGQQQLVGVARAVIARPALLLADEPTGNLHSGQAREIMRLFQELNQQGTTIVQVTHSEENARAGSRIVQLHDGWITRTHGADHAHRSAQAIRQLLRARGFTLVAVLSLALGIGANTAMFSLANATLLRPVASDAAARCCASTSIGTAVDHRDVARLRETVPAFATLAGERLERIGRTDGATPTAISGSITVGAYFETLGVQPALGRLFGGAEGAASASTVVLSHAYWTSALGGDSSVVGRTLRLNGHPFVVVGVAARGFRSSAVLFSPDVFFPTVAAEPLFGVRLADWGGSFYLVGRLAPGATRARADAELQVAARRIAAEDPARVAGDRRVAFRTGVARGVLEELRGAFAAGSAFLLALAGLVLLIACANVQPAAVRAAARARWRGCTGGGGKAALSAEPSDRPEELRQRVHERLRRRRRSEGERRALHHRLARAGRPDVDRPALRIDRPVLRDVSLLIQPALGEAVRAGRARAEHLDDQREPAEAIPVTGRRVLAGDDEEIGPHERVREAPRQVALRPEHHPLAMSLDERDEGGEQAYDDDLVPDAGGRRHEQLAVHGLVAPTRIRVDERAYHVGRVVRRFGVRHAHSIVSAPGGRQARPRSIGVPPSTVRTAATHPRAGRRAPR